MESKDVFTAIGLVVSALTVVLGWFVEQHRNREHEKLKIRLSKTEEIAEIIINRKLPNCGFIRSEGKESDDQRLAEHQENIQWWGKVFLLVQVYGTKEVQNAFDEYDDVVKKGGALAEQISALNKLKDMLVKSIRSDLGYK